MIKTKKKIFHIADTQFEIRNSGEGNRNDEFKNSMVELLSKIKLENPDITCYTGDVFQFCNTTSAERKIFSWFFRELSKICTVVVTNGNHDLKQRNNELIMNHKSVVEPDDIDSELSAMAIPNIHYLKRTGFYDIDGIKFAVWGHYEKFNKVENDQLPYSPWDLEIAKDIDPRLCIELFHDPIKNCKGFDNKPMEKFTDYKIDKLDFKSPLILAGDIHMPDIITFQNPLYGYSQTFTYCSSTVMRNFGEGNYYRNGILTKNGNDNHGYNIVEYTLMEDGDVTSSVVFHSLKPTVSRHTIILDGEFDYNNLSMLRIDSTEFNFIRFKIDDNVSSFFENQDVIYKYMKDFCDCFMYEPVFDKSVGVEFDDENNIDDVENIINNDKILELADIYIGKAVDKTTTISKEDAPEAKEMLNKLFKDEFSKSDELTKNIKKINVKKMSISNGLTFGDNVEIDFDKIGNIVRVTGANAVGKTKVFTLVGYMFTDLLHADQKPSQHKNNRLEVFNYNRPNDTVSIEMDFEVNGIPHKLTKVIGRSWKRGKSMWEDKDWKTFVAGTPTLDITLIKGGEDVVTDYDEIMGFMGDLVSFEEFYSHLFVNQRSLENLLKMNTDILIGEILKIIGLNFFSSLNDSFDEVREKKMDALTKPSGTIESLLNEIAVNKGFLENIALRKSEILLDFKSIDEDKVTKLEDISKLKQSIGNIRKVSEVEADITSKNSEISKNIADKKVLKEVVDADKLEITKIVVADIDLEIEESRKSQTEITTKKANTQTLLDNIQKDADNKQKEIDTFITSEENKINTKVNLINTDINTLKSENTKSNERLVEVKEVVASNLKIKVDNNNLKISTQQAVYDKKVKENKEFSDIYLKGLNSLSVLETNLSNKNSTLESYTNSDKCNSCGEYVGEGIDDKIKSIKQDIGNITVDIETNKEFGLIEKSEYENSKISMESEAKVLEDMKKVVITHTITDEVELIGEVRSIAASLSANKKVILEKESEIEVIKLDKTYLENELVVRLKKEISNVSLKKVEYADSIKTFDTKYTELSTAINRLESKKVLRNEIELRLVSNESKLKSLDKDAISLDSGLDTLNKELDLSKGVVSVHTEIEEIEKILETYEESRLVLQREDVGLDNKLTLSKKIVEDNEESIKELKKYNLTTSVLKQYKSMLGKSGLQKYIFSKIVTILNGKLSILLEDVSMRLFFDKDNLELRKFDIGNNIVSGVKMASGMESSILGLSLLKSLKELNQIRKFNILMVDEISGQLNNGDGLSYKAYDYQGLFVKLLSKIKEDTCVYVVDHVIENLGEAYALEFSKTDDGSVVNRINF